MVSFKSIEKINLEKWPTPMHEIPRYGKSINHNNLYVKRDDISLTGLGGNKLRSLEYWLAQSLAREADLVIVAGGCQSNLVRLTAAACAKVNLKCLAIHNCAKPKVLKGNVLLNKLFGAEQIFLGDVSEEDRDSYVSQKIQEYNECGIKTYYVNEEEIGSLGYLNCILEIDEQKPDLTHLVIVGAMGVTASGFVYGNKKLNKKYKIHVISVEYPKDKLVRILGEKLSYIERKLSGEEVINREEIDLIETYNTYVYDDWMGQGWGKPTDQSLKTIVQIARNEGIVLDHVYNAKTFTGLAGLIENNIIKKDEATCIVLTGGAPAIFGDHGVYNQILNDIESKQPRKNITLFK